MITFNPPSLADSIRVANNRAAASAAGLSFDQIEQLKEQEFAQATGMAVHADNKPKDRTPGYAKGGTVKGAKKKGLPKCFAAGGPVMPEKLTIENPLDPTGASNRTVANTAAVANPANVALRRSREQEQRTGKQANGQAVFYDPTGMRTVGPANYRDYSEGKRAQGGARWMGRAFDDKGGLHAVTTPGNMAKRRGARQQQPGVTPTVQVPQAPELVPQDEQSPNLLDPEAPGYAKGGDVEAPEVDNGEVKGPEGYDAVPAEIDGKQPAKLTKGEYVVTVDEVKAIGGVPKLKELLANAVKQSKGEDADEATEPQGEADIKEDAAEGEQDDMMQYGTGGEAGKEPNPASNGQGKATWFAAAAAKGGYNPTTGKFTKGPFAGKTLKEAQLAAPQVYAGLAANNPAQDETWDARANGREARPTKVKQLPKSMRSLPNAPDLSEAAVRDPIDGSLIKSGASPTAATKFKNSALNFQSKKDTARQAVTDTKNRQMANVPAVVDRAIEAKNQELAKDGIVDMGGGTKSLNNKYGSAVITTGNKPRAMGTKPGAVMDEKGVVDASKLKGATTTPYVPGSTNTPALNMDARDAARNEIASKVAAAAPGAAERLAADRTKEVARVQGNVNRALMKTAGDNIIPAAKQAPQTVAAAAPAVLPAVASAVTGSPIAGALTNAAFQYMRQ